MFSRPGWKRAVFVIVGGCLCYYAVIIAHRKMTEREAIGSILGLGGTVGSIGGWPIGKEYSITFEGVDLRDEDTRLLANLAKIKTGSFGISLRGTKISDASVPHLKRLTNLRFLDLRGTEISVDGIRQLQHAIPACSILYDMAPQGDKDGSDRVNQNTHFSMPDS